MASFKPQRISFKNLFALLLFILFAFAQALGLTAKDRWAKDNSESLIIRPADEPAILNVGGPDGYGYYYYDSNDSASNAPTYNWVNITTRGTSIGFYEDDQVLGPYNIGFTFNFYGQNYTTFRICSNGWISFGSTLPEFQNRPIPTPDEPNNLLAVFWDDLVTDSSRTYRYSNSDSCIIAWHNFHHYPNSGSYTFEIVLTRSGGITFQYQSVSGILNSHTIGIENSTGSAGLQYNYNTYDEETGRAIYFGTRPPHYASNDVMPSSFRGPTLSWGQAGTSITPIIRFTNAGNLIETFYGRLRILHNGELYNQTRQISSLRPDSSSQSTFPVFTPNEIGSYQMIATSELSTDEYHPNDTISVSYYAYGALYSMTFETNNGSFLGNHDWQWGTATQGPSSAHSGVKLWGTRLAGDYTVGPLLSSLYSDTLLLDSAAVLTFWQWYNTEAMFDGGNVKISTDDGLTWTILNPEGGYDGTLANAFQNPMGGQPAFYGISNGWVMETVDLSAYAGTVAIIRFDFGSDISDVSYGWYIDDFTVINGGLASPGWIQGVVRDASEERIPGALVTAGNRRQTTDILGRYLMPIPAGSYAVTASAAHYNPFTMAGVVVFSGDTTLADLYLTSPTISADTSAIDTSFIQGHTISVTRQIQNTGSGPLDFSIRINSEMPRFLRHDHGRLDASNGAGADDPVQLFDFSDEVFTFNPQDFTNDDGCVGVEFDGKYFWVTGRHGVDEFHKLHKFDRDGNYIASYEQNTRSLWGWRDLAFDGRYLYASDENELAKIDTATGMKVDTLHAPSGIVKPLRGLAYDPQSDHFWAASFNSNIVEFTRTGATIRSFPNQQHIFGLAWDNASLDGPWLWVFSQDSIPPLKVSQFDPREGAYTGVAFTAIDHNGGDPDQPGGACFTSDWDQSKGILFCMVQGRTTPFDSFDLVQGYEITPMHRWLHAEPMSGTIGPGESQELTVTLDFSDTLFVPDSAYSGSITIFNNSAVAPTIQVSAGVLSAVGDGEPGTLPREFSLSQNYPNPFNSTTMIRFSLPQASDVKLEVFNILGQKVSTLLDNTLSTGNYSVPWNAAGVSSGIYFLKISAGSFSDVKMMSLLK